MNYSLKSIKKSIVDENISYGEIIWLQNHKQEVLDSDDMILAQWAGISEEEWNKKEAK